MTLPLMDGLPSDWTMASGLHLLHDALNLGGPAHDIGRAGLQLTTLLLTKNAAYGNSALKPLQAFAKDVSPRQRMAIRMDDKLNRIINGTTFGAENERIDLAGYLLLDYIASHQDRP